MEHFLESISSMLQNTYSQRISKMLEAENIVVFGFDKKIKSILKLFKKHGRKATHICVPNKDEHFVEVFNKITAGRYLPFVGNNYQLIFPEDVLKLSENTAVLIAWDGVMASFYADYFLKGGLKQVAIYPLLGQQEERRHCKEVIKHLPNIWKVYNLLADDISRQTYLSIINYWITGDLMSIKMSDYPQYFHKEVKPTPGDVVIDGGAYDGATAVDFANAMSMRGTIYSFEPEKMNTVLANKMIHEKGLEKMCTIVEAGLGDTEEKLILASNSAASSFQKGQESTEEGIQLTTIDSFMMNKNEKVDLIKLDVEGFEIATIKGAYNVIQRDKPRLQVCVYHKFEDLWEIPLLLSELRSDYKFYLGHHYIQYSDAQLQLLLGEQQQRLCKNFDYNGKVIHYIETVLYAI